MFGGVTTVDNCPRMGYKTIFFICLILAGKSMYTIIKNRKHWKEEKGEDGLETKEESLFRRVDLYVSCGTLIFASFFLFFSGISIGRSFY